MTQVVKASVTGTEYSVPGIILSSFSGFYDSFSGDEAAVAGVPA